LRKGDQILRVGDVKVKTNEELVAALQQVKNNATSVTVLREGQEQTVAVKWVEERK